MINEDAPTFPHAVAWGLDQLDAHEDSAARVSITMGLAGVGLLLFLFATSVPIALELLQKYTPSGPPGFLFETTVVQSLLLPPLVSGTIVVSAIFFWHIAVSLRFVAGLLVVVPAVLSFIGLMMYLESSMDVTFAKATCASMFAVFVSAGTVALTVQMWSPWTLCHLRDDSVPLPPLGTRALFELTGVTAISFAIIIALSGDPELNSNEFIIALVFFAAFGFILSLAGIGLCFAFLRKPANQRSVALIAFALTFTAATLLPGTVAVAEFGWNVLSSDLLMVALASTYGSIVISTVAGIHLWWLRICGWQCVDRRRRDARPIPPN